MSERFINFMASIITIANIVVAIPQAFNPQLRIIDQTFFSSSSLFFRLGLLIILEASLSYLLLLLIKLFSNNEKENHIVIILLCIVSVAVTFYNVEHILIGHQIVLGLHKLIFMKYFILFGFFWALSVIVFASYELDIDCNPAAYIWLTIFYIVFYISLFFN